MLSNKPYLMRAFYDWIVDSGYTPLVVLNANHPKCRIPLEYAGTEEIVFNISPSAIRDLKITNIGIEFKASFTGVIHYVSAPIKAVNAVYAEENNEGVFFDLDDGEEEDVSESVQLRGIEGSANVSAISQDPHSAENIVAGSSRERPVLKLVE